MKKLILLFSLLACIGFTACSDDDSDDKNKEYLILNLSDFNLSNGGNADQNGGKYWNGTFLPNASLKSQGFTFSHTATDWGSFKSWNGFTVTNSKDDTDMSSVGWTSYQWSNVAGGSSITGLPYLVAFWDSYLEKSIEPGKFDEAKYSNWIKIDNSELYRADAVYVTNSSWSYYSIKNGDSSAKKFEQGDYFLLKVYGVKEDGTITEPVLHYLADYRSTDSKSWTLNNKWEKVDLTSLGEVKYIYFQMDSSDKGEYGINTPTYFCLEWLSFEKK